MVLNLIRIIAVYEMRTLLRSWFFRIFAGGAIFGLGIFNIAMNVDASGAPWIYKALSCSIPYANLIVLNLGQAVVAIFLGSEFLKQDRKNDSIEVIYARSMTNGTYIAGKTLGILAVFLVLNVLVLLMGIGFSFLSDVSSQSILAYFTYPLLISLPTLIFILGLSFFIMVLVKNQAVTFILLTGYIALTVFYLDKKAYHLFDYIAYQVPMLHSSIAGFGNFGEILLHRSIYFVAGVGLIFLTIYKLNRLPQSNRFVMLPLFIGCLLLLSSGFMVYKYLGAKLDAHRYRDQVMALNNRYAGLPIPLIDSCRLDLEHRGDEIAVKSELLMHNSNNIPLDTLIFSLNPDLSLTGVVINGKPAEYLRDLQIIRVIPVKPLQTGETLNVQMQYEGKINEHVAFLDHENRTFDENPSFEVFRLHKRYAFIRKDYICLTPDVLWYPVSGTGYAKDKPMYYAPDFVNYAVRVTTKPDLTSISQGKMIKSDAGITEFETEYPLTRISLLVGNYVKYSVNVDSIEYSLYTIKGHDYFKTFFPDANDTIPHLIRELKKEYEAALGLKYPFNRLIFAEVPVHFAIATHIYSYASDAVQPELILCPEKGVLFNSSDFKGRKYRLEKDMKNNNEEALPVVVQADLFNEFFRDNFMAKRGQRFNYEHLINWHTYSILPQYLSFYASLHSERWPVLGIALETYLSERNNNAGTSLQWYEDLTPEEKINLELRDASLEELLKKGIEPEEGRDNPIAISDVVQIKGLSFFNTLNSRYGSAEVDTLLNRLLKDHAHRRIDFPEISERFSSRFNADLSEEADKWYAQKELPGYIIKNMANYKVLDGEATKYQVRFQISNPENADGIITLNIEFNDPNRRKDNVWDNSFNVDFSKKLYMPAKSSFEVGYAFNSEPARMSLVTHISRNLPNNLVFNLSGFSETRNTALVDNIIPIGFFNKSYSETEFIADNEDRNFIYQQATNQAYLKSLVKKNKSDRYKYSAIWWNPPKEWRAVLRSEFYGEYVRSAYYTRSGNGERTALWQTPLPQEGSYDVYYHINKVQVGWRTSRSSDYNLTVYHDNGMDKINHSTENADAGWNYIGTWYISADTGKVELSNISNGETVFADAVKWVLNK